MGKAFNQADLTYVSYSGLIIRLQGHCYKVHSPLEEGVQIVPLAIRIQVSFEIVLLC